MGKKEEIEMKKERISRKEAEGIKEEYTQIKEEIVKFLEEDSEFGSTRGSIESDSRLPPAQTYSLLLELVSEGRIEEIAGYYFIKK